MLFRTWKEYLYMNKKNSWTSCCCCSVNKSCLTLCNHRECSITGSSVLHYLQSVMQPNHLITPFYCLQSFPASGSLQMSWFSASGGQSIGASASSSALPKNIQSWYHLGLTDLIPLLSRGFSSIFFSTTFQMHQFFRHSTFFMVQLSHLYMTTGKTIALTIWIFVSKVRLCFLIHCLGLK